MDRNQWFPTSWFDNNYEQFGYRFPKDGVEGTLYWEKDDTDIKNFYQAQEIADATTAELAPYQRVRRGDFLLSGMLFTPDGVPYWADAPADAYRVGNKGKRISRWQIESAVLDRLQHDIRSPNFQRKLVAEMHRQADAIDIGNERIDDELAVRKKQIGNLLGLAAEGSKAAVAKVRELEAMWTRQYEAARTLALTDPAPEGAGKKGKKAKQ